MTLPVVVIRPEPGCSTTVAQAGALGLKAHAFPLSEIIARDWQPPAAETIDALLVGSANVFRYGGPGLAVGRGKPVYAMGETTAAAAREAGFAVAAVGSGGLQAVLETVPSPLRLLRLAGEEHVALELPPGVMVDTRIVYAAMPLPMSPALANVVRGGAVVLLHSAASARHFAAECQRLVVARGAIALAALGPRISPAAGKGWRAVRAAARPSEAALLALASDLCHEMARREGS